MDRKWIVIKKDFRIVSNVDNFILSRVLEIARQSNR